MNGLGVGRDEGREEHSDFLVPASPITICPHAAVAGLRPREEDAARAARVRRWPRWPAKGINHSSLRIVSQNSKQKPHLNDLNDAAVRLEQLDDERF